jgi:3,8-divinyl chlorophyllide a/chlorophyllide a reductase subunit Y
VKPEKVAAAQNAFLPAIKAGLAANPIKGTITLSGYEGSELLVARLLIESGAEVPYVGTACPKTPGPRPMSHGWRRKGVKVKFRASLEDDCAAMEAIRPISPSAPRPWCRRARRWASPSLYFTNLISARPLMGPAGAGSLARWSMPPWPTRTAWTTCASSSRVSAKAIPRASGKAPNLRPDFRAAHQKKLDKLARAAKAEEMI